MMGGLWVRIGQWFGALCLVAWCLAAFGLEMAWGCQEGVAEVGSAEVVVAGEPAQGVGPAMLVVVGAAGEKGFGEQFLVWAERLRSGLKGIDFEMIDGTRSEGEDSDQDRRAVLSWVRDVRHATAKERWLVMIGHGTNDASGAKFNLRGDDLTPAMLAQAMKEGGAIGDGASVPVWVVVNCSSSSAPFLNALSGANRIVISATKSGAEQNFSRFGDYFTQALIDPKSDLDHDRGVSVLEAFLAASGKVQEFYRDEDRLATEQALLDDNGDQRGTPASFFRGIRAVQSAANQAELDGRLARRVGLVSFESLGPVDPVRKAEQAGIEIEIENLRREKGTMVEAEYYDKLEELMLRLAESLQMKVTVEGGKDP